MKNLFLFAVLLFSFATASAQTDKKTQQVTDPNTSNPSSVSTTKEQNGMAIQQDPAATKKGTSKKGKATKTTTTKPTQTTDGTTRPDGTGTGTDTGNSTNKKATGTDPGSSTAPMGTGTSIR